MSLAKNIVRYRKKNHLSQEDLSKSLNISRQSISKWETGENLPSINNLISLSGLLDISLDELITGEPYLRIPFDYGKPKSKQPAFWLIVTMLIVSAIGLAPVQVNVWQGIAICIGFDIMIYVMIVCFYPFNYKDYYDYWTIGRKGITYLDSTKTDKSFLKEVIMPIKALLHLRKTKYVPYKDIQKIEIAVDLYENNPRKVLAYSLPSIGQMMQEKFYLTIATTDDKQIILDLGHYNWSNSKEHKMLPTILSFLQRKNIEYVDKQGITDIVKDRNSSVITKLYEERGSLERKQANVSSK